MLPKQIWLLLRHGLRLDWTSKERLVSPLLFALVMLTVFTFTAGQMPAMYAKPVFVSQTFLVLVFALQNAFSRILDPEQKDQVAELLRTYPISMGAWYTAKLLLAVLHGLWILLPSLLVSSLFYGEHDVGFSFYLGFLGILLLCLIGLASVGTLATAMTLQASGKDLIQPLLYFTLAIPLLLAGSQASLQLLQSQNLEDFRHWIYLLVAFDTLFVTVGVLFFGIVMSDAS